MNQKLIPDSDEKMIETHLSAFEMLPVLLDVIRHCYTIKLEDLEDKTMGKTEEELSFMCNKSAVLIREIESESSVDEL